MSVERKDLWYYIKYILIYTLLTLGAIFVLFPFFWMLSTAFKPLGTHFTIPIEWIPRNPTLENYRIVFREYAFGRAFFNSFIVSVSAAVMVATMSTMAGYAFGKKNFPGRDQLFWLLLSTMMIPGLMFMIPQFIVVRNLGWMNTYRAMFLPHTANVFFVFLVRQYVKTIPNELLDAARIDGAGEWLAFRNIILPLAKPIIATMFLLTFQGQWTNFLWQYIVAPRESMMTLPVALARFQGQYGTYWTLIMAAGSLSIIPIAIIFLFAQKYFIEGIQMGAIKG
ncbi:carbohydrate ABC transporter permease [Anaerobranca gottschalkii]|uniref:Multiple sugar transport system permease protein n=1 Tax=Anaerobranca gottschalkii DSM 13577 TaxID=1120990 RepID=A0A1H9ZS23_9FIRM|nr:carbohydrate ABC transporter permease [Anaerobranca gottschalkii]SES84164.1 multiple sugar transport system permease protein [Anaerobranca gottschalkii DSM 13577]